MGGGALSREIPRKCVDVIDLYIDCREDEALYYV